MTRTAAAMAGVAGAALGLLGGCGSGSLQPKDGAAAVDAADAPVVLDGAHDVPAVSGVDARDVAAADLPPRPDGLSFDGAVSEGTQCHALPNTAPYFVPQTMAADAVPPDLHGGPIPDGVFELVAAEFYPGDAATAPTLMRRTVQFETGGARWLITDFSLNGGAATNTRPSATLAVGADGALTATFDACFAASGGGNVYRYAATADMVTMWFERTRLLLHYLRAP